VDDIAAELDISEQVAATRVDRLLAHGGATIDSEGFVTRMNAGWQAAYQGRIAHREAQLEAVLRFAGGAGCRMAALLEHFGDRDRAGLPCGHCDFCAPDECTVKRVRKPTERESELLQAILFTLAERDGRTPKQLIEAAFPNGELDRRGIGELLRALAQAGAIRIEEAEFEKDGRTIRFEKVWLTREGKEAGAEAATWVHMPDGATGAGSASDRKTRKSVAKQAITQAESKAEPDANLVRCLKQWRLKQSKEEGVPAFRILGNKTLNAIAIHKPSTEDELLKVPGIGPQKLEAYGAAILRVLAE
jgi:superfamily II DNA helicase RecQ